jgi:hypothetical protein
LPKSAVPAYDGEMLIKIVCHTGLVSMAERAKVIECLPVIRLRRC